MKSIANQYRDLKEGKMTQQNFMRNLRMSMPQFITNVTSFGDAVRILKNKSIITEAPTFKSKPEEKPKVQDGNTVELDGILRDLYGKPFLGGYFLDYDKSPVELVLHISKEPAQSGQKTSDIEKLGTAVLFRDSEWSFDGVRVGANEQETLDKIAALAFPTQNEIKEELDTKKVYGGTGQNQGDTGSSLQFTVIEDNPEYFEIDFILTPNSKYRQAGAGSRSPREKEYGYVKVSKADFDGYVTAKGEKFYIGKDFITANLQTNKDNEVKPSEDELDAILKGVEQEKAGEEAVNAQYDLEETEELNEGKKKEEKEYSKHQCNPTELRLGIRTELEHGDMELDKAKEIAYKNIAKDPIYYTKLKLSGVEAHPKKVKGEKAVPAKKAKKETIQLVDLINGMQKVKMPKAEEKKKLKENQLNEGGEYTFIGKLNSAELKKIHEIIPDIEIDVEQDDDMERTTITSKFYNNKFIEQAVDGVINPPKSTMRPGVDIGASFEKMKKSMEEIIRETVSEYFDGRDNLVNPLSAEEENK